MKAIITIFTSNNEHNMVYNINSIEEFKKLIYEPFFKKQNDTISTINNKDGSNATYIFRNSDIKEIKILWTEGIPKFILEEWGDIHLKSEFFEILS